MNDLNPSRYPAARRRSGSFIALFLLVNLLATWVTQAADKTPTNTPSAIPWNQIGAKAGANCEGDGLAVTPTEAGARLRCVFQRLDGEGTPEGLWLTSTVTNTVSDRFRVSAMAVGRNTANATFNFAYPGASIPSAGVGDVSVCGQTVRFSGPGLTEEYSVSMDGVRQDFIVEQAPPSPPDGELVVKLAVMVTDAVHKAGGRIIAQLWHTGSLSHPDLLNGASPVSASKVNPSQMSVTPSGRKPTVTPRAMTTAEIYGTVGDHSNAAANAMEAGFDGVQVQANYLYLIPQFLNTASNVRTDECGGSVKNRARFLFEMLESVLKVMNSGVVGIKIAPMHEKGAFAANDETLPTIEYVIKRLNDYCLSHLLMVGASTDFSGSPIASLTGDGMFRHFRPIFKGPLIANVKMDRERGNLLIADGMADLIAFGRPYISNPDLVERFATNAPLNNDIKLESIYGPGPEGYVDYPKLKPVEEPADATW